MARVLHKDIGDLWSEPQATFTVSDVATDPTNLTVKQQAPDGTETTILNNVLVSSLTTSSTPIKKVSTGVFQPNPGISLSSSGHWFLRYEGTGTVTAAEEWEVIVDPSEFTAAGGLSDRALVSLYDAKDWLNQNRIDTADDLELVRVINDASERFHYEAEREFKRVDAPVTTAVARSFFPDCLAQGYGIVNVGDMNALGTTPAVRILSSDWTTVVQSIANTDVILLPENRQPWEPARRLIFKSTVVSPATMLPGYRVEVTATWGFPSVPGNVRQAVLDTILSMLDREVEHYAQDVGPTTTGGGTNVIVLGGNRAQLLSLPPSALAVARSFRDPLV